VPMDTPVPRPAAQSPIRPATNRFPTSPGWHIADRSLPAPELPQSAAPDDESTSTSSSLLANSLKPARIPVRAAFPATPPLSIESTVNDPGFHPPPPSRSTAVPSSDHRSCQPRRWLVAAPPDREVPKSPAACGRDHAPLHTQSAEPLHRDKTGSILSAGRGAIRAV